MEYRTTKNNKRNRSSDFIIKIHSHEQASFKGTIEHIQSGQVQYFRSFLEMFVLIQDKLNETDFPQATTQLRSWTE